MKKLLLLVMGLFIMLTGIVSNVQASTYGSGTYGGSTYGGQSTTSSSNNSSAPGQPGCLDQQPGGKAPWLYGAIATSATTIDLYFTAADDPVDHYVLEYGTTSGNYQYGSENIGGHDTRISTIKSLAPGKKYFFRVRGGNGCAVGGWSNEVSASTRNLSINSKQLNMSSELIPVSHTPTPMTNSEIKQINLSPTPGPISPGYELRVVVQNSNKQPIANADVTLHSEPRMSKTNERGEAVFTNVEGGEHSVIVAYDGYEGEQKLYLTGDTKTIDLRITVEQKQSNMSKYLLPIVSVLAIVVVILLFLIFKRKHNDSL